MLKQRRLQKGKKLLSSDEEIDPMVYAVNMIDCMLVLAVGFLIFTIMSSAHTSGDTTTSDNTIIKEAVDLNTAQNLTSTLQNSSSSTSGLAEVGKVYKDPTTGKYIMIQSHG